MQLMHYDLRNVVKLPTFLLQSIRFIEIADETQFLTLAIWSASDKQFVILLAMAFTSLASPSAQSGQIMYV